ncbi:cytochrome P450 [Mycena galericulata]|nr:cytochrome P450 [Mycena galericulata]
MPTSLTPLALGAVVLWFSIRFLRCGQRERGLPPGPPTIPFLGNLHLLPDGGKFHLKFMEWSQEYGDIFSIKLASSTMVVLSSATAIKQVVDKQGWAASSRPPNELARLAAGGFHILFAPDTARLRKLRTTIARFLAPQNSLKRVPVLAAESTQLLHELMNQPENFSDSIRRQIYWKITMYGQRVSSFASPQVKTFYKILHQFLHILVPGVYPPIDLLPTLKYIPEFCAPWIPACRRSKSELASFHTKLSAAAKEGSKKLDGELPESFMDLISNMGLSQEEFPVFSYGGFTLVEAGSDTVAAFLLSLVLILALHPEHQERARREVESVVGSTRLPELDDFERMPFVNALIKEAIRIRPSFPIGAPHYTTDEIHASPALMFGTPFNTSPITVQELHPSEEHHRHPEHMYDAVSSASTIMNHILITASDSVFHNPDIFEDPDVFNPDRFIQSQYGTRPGMDADFRDNFLFGGGRRICPGQYAATAMMQLTTMRLLWAFEFRSAVDAQTGKPLTRKLDCYAPEFVVMPYPFKCAIELHRGECQGIITQAFKDARNLLACYEH